MREKTYSGTPFEERFKIENIRSGNCTILFFDNVEEKQEEEESISYQCDLYKIEVTYRENLQESIEKNYDKWLKFAKDSDYEKVATEVRKKRDELLKETDWTQMSDNSVSSTMLEKYQEYRQKLRDVPQQDGFPYDVEFPKITNEEG